MSVATPSIVNVATLRNRVLALKTTPKDCSPDSDCGKAYASLQRAQERLAEIDAVIVPCQDRINRARHALANAGADSDFAMLAGEETAIAVLTKKIAGLQEEHDRRKRDLQSAENNARSYGMRAADVRERLLRLIPEGMEQVRSAEHVTEAINLLAGLCGPLPDEKTAAAAAERRAEAKAANDRAQAVVDWNGRVQSMAFMLAGRRVRAGGGMGATIPTDEEWNVARATLASQRPEGIEDR